MQGVQLGFTKLSHCILGVLDQSGAMRPRSLVEVVTIFTRTDAEGNWIPQKIEVNSWVTLTPGSVGGHAKDAKKHGGSGMVGSYKVKVLEFKISVHGSVSMVKVQHAYMWRQLDLNPEVPYEMSAACNCKSSCLPIPSFILWLTQSLTLSLTKHAFNPP